MLTSEQLTHRMEQVGRQVAELAETPDDPASITAGDLLRTLGDLHAEGLQRILAIVRSGGEASRPLLEKLAQDDLIRALLLFYDLHPIDLRTRLTEVVENLRPLVESYAGTISLAGVDRQRVRLRLMLPAARGPSPAGMVKELFKNAILVAAPDVAEVDFDESPAADPAFELPIISIR